MSSVFLNSWSSNSCRHFPWLWSNSTAIGHGHLTYSGLLILGIQGLLFLPRLLRLCLRRKAIQKPFIFNSLQQIERKLRQNVLDFILFFIKVEVSR